MKKIKLNNLLILILTISKFYSINKNKYKK